MADNLLYDTKRDFMKYARMLPEIEIKGKKTNKYEDYDINVLADGYCKATDEKNEYLRNVYLSALIMRFWYTIDKMYYKLRGTDFDRIDVFNRLYECIIVACEYRAWQNPNKHTNAQACINQVLACRGVPAMIAEYNQKHHAKLVYSLDNQIDDETNATIGDITQNEEEYQRRQSEEKAIGFVQALVQDDKIIEAIIADNMAFKDVYKHYSKSVKSINEEGEEVKHIQTSTEFWPFQLVKELNSLNDDYYKYFAKMYYVKDEKLQPAKEALEKATNQRKYKYIDCAKETMKKYFYLLR